MSKNTILVKWAEINKQNIPNTSGVYAWYYGNVLSKCDIESVIECLNSSEEENKKKLIVKEYLEKHLFSPYQEPPYNVSISGKLKAKYEGTVFHQQVVADELTDKILKQPSLLKEIKKSLSDFDYSFSSPLYIGMSKNLQKRLDNHKELIKKYRTAGFKPQCSFSSKEEESEHNFASRVVSKNFSETDLYVIIKEVTEEYSLHNVIEHVLNRINYPILGRN